MNQRKRKPSRENKKQRRQIEKEKKKNQRKTRRNNLSRFPPRRRGGQHLKKNELEKIMRKKYNYTTPCKQSKTNNQGKNIKG